MSKNNTFHIITQKLQPKGCEIPKYIYLCSECKRNIGMFGNYCSYCGAKIVRYVKGDAQ